MLPAAAALRVHSAPACRAFAALACLLVWGLAAPAASAQTVSPPDPNITLPSFPIANGHYYSQAAGDDPAKGYTITNDGGIAFWDAFQRLGGVDAVGFPSTGRFTWMGFTDQATQKLILQWNPAGAQADVVNTFDVLQQLGLDPQLLARRQTPPAFDNSADKGLSWPQIVARHQAELNWNAAIKARYFSDSDPIAHFGLPQSYGDEGNVLVVRCQRAVFQQWKVEVPWAHAGEVTIANGGDIAKEFGILPAVAATTTPAAGLIVTPYNTTTTVSPDQVNAIQAAAATVRPALVSIASDFGAGHVGFGSGVVIDPAGLILTDAHVVNGAQRILVGLSDGRTVPAQLVGQDVLPDVAVLRVPVTGLPAAARGSSAGLSAGSPLVAVGFTPYFPTPPAVRFGHVITIQPGNYSNITVNRVVDDLFTVFGDSGGPVVNLQGQVVGIADAISLIRVHGRLVKFGLENGFESDLAIANQIIAAGKSIIRTIDGFDDVVLTPAIAGQIGTPFTPGVLVVWVDAHSSAEAAGLAPGDIVTSMDGMPTTVSGAVGQVLGRHHAGDAIPVTFLDPDGNRHTVSITLSGE